MSSRPPARNLTREPVFKRFFTLEVLRAEPASMKHDGFLPAIEREVLNVGHVGAILLYNPDSDEILLNQQFRMAAFAAGDVNPFMFEVAAGLVDDGETPEEAARREAVEETGTPVTDVELIGVFYPSAGTLQETYHLYVGRIAKAAPGIHGLADEGEEIRTHLLPAAKAVAMCDAGEIRNGMAALALHWFARNRERLRTKWRHT